MIHVAQPGMLAVAMAGALVTCVLHLLSVRRPPVLLLPTMRFLPDRPVRAVSRSARPSDLWLLLLRVLALLLVGVALSGVSWRGSRVTHGRVIVVDRAGAPRAQSALRERVGEVLRARTAGDTATRLVLLDSVAHRLTVPELRAFSADTLSVSPVGSTLSAALLAGVQAAGVLVHDERNVDSVELVIVSSFTSALADAALPAVRRAWPGRVRLVDVTVSDSAVRDSTRPASRVTFAGAAPNDGVRSAFGGNGRAADARVTGVANAGVANAAGAANAVGAGNASAPNAGGAANAAAPNAAGTASARAVALEWPASGVPAGWTRTAPDTIGGLVAGGEAVVWPFVRTARVPDSLLRRARPIAWWSDGVVAAIERSDNGTCARQVGAIIAGASNVLQGPSARALRTTMAAPCGSRRNFRALSPVLRAMLAGSGAAAAAGAFRDAASAETPWASVLLALALLLLALEWWMRDREDSVVAEAAEPVAARRVA